MPEQLAMPEHSGRAARIGLWALAIGFGGFLLWAGLAPLDEGVPSQGMISIDTKKKTVQHLTGGLVKEVLVGEGDHVKEGQLLVRLDEAVARANFEAARQRYVGLRAMEGRLMAEQQGQSKIVFHPDVVEASKALQISDMVRTQEQLLNSRRASLQAELQSIEESVQGQIGLIQAYEGMLVNRKNQQALLAEELGNTRELATANWSWSAWLPRPARASLSYKATPFAPSAPLLNSDKRPLRVNKTTARKSKPNWLMLAVKSLGMPKNTVPPKMI
jgi:protease secretion system membrane fusion protein